MIVTKKTERKMNKMAALYDEYHELAADPANQPGEIKKRLMRKYGLKALSTVYRWLEREEARRNG